MKICLAALCLFAVLCGAPVAAQETHLLVVSGLGGAPEYSDRFRDWGAALVQAAERSGLRPENVVWLAENADLHPRVDGVARLDPLRGAVAAVAGRAAAADDVVLVLFGHGAARGGETRLNLPGPDLSAGELAAMLDGLGDRRVAVVNAASASGGFLDALKSPNRVVMTATRSAGQNEATRFGGHFVDAFTGDGADADRDGRVSLLEAFEYARREVERFYGTGGRLQTEHAVLEDAGELAARIALAPGRGGEAGAGGRAAAGAGGAGAAAAADPELRRLYERRDSLQAELRALRSRQAELEPAEYQAALERLLLEVARTGRAIREQEGETDG